MWIVCITSVRHVLTVNGYGGRQTKENEKSWCFKGWETLVNKISSSSSLIQALTYIKSGRILSSEHKKPKLKHINESTCLTIVCFSNRKRMFSGAKTYIFPWENISFGLGKHRKPKDISLIPHLRLHENGISPAKIYLSAPTFP